MSRWFVLHTLFTVANELCHLVLHSVEVVVPLDFFQGFISPGVSVQKSIMVPLDHLLLCSFWHNFLFVCCLVAKGKEWTLCFSCRQLGLSIDQSSSFCC